MPGPAIPLSDARRLVIEAARPLGVTAVALGDARGRVLAEGVIAAGDVPPFDTSAMDGYAVRSGPAGRRLRIAGEARAGAPAAGSVAPDTAIAISTGAAVPAGADAVIAVEQTSRAGDVVVLDVAVEPGRNLRRAGEDLPGGERVLTPGTRLGPETLAVAAAAGRSELRCGVPARVAIVITGDELTALGAALPPGAIHDSNGVMLRALAAAAGAPPVSVVRAPDEEAATTGALAAAIQSADVVVSTGGVSVGEHDHVRSALGALGVKEHFWRVALKPGKPVWFGVADGVLVFGLPGNPASAAVCFHLFVAPALRTIEGAPALTTPLTARLTQPATGARGRTHAVRVTLSHDAGGRLLATPTGAQDSHRLASLVDADGLALLPADSDLAAGDEVTVEPV